ncbi:unnamed protein product [Acanthosepion pharaonis]|uniref:Uncharacterized protein n=1 Tax=Acanthosepion pharaonis TaxID=158019 RepID=A0A812EMW1_ACAPH|nr:unnamed protein product [Sepia pharaonis]
MLSFWFFQVFSLPFFFYLILCSLFLFYLSLKIPISTSLCITHPFFFHLFLCKPLPCWPPSAHFLFEPLHVLFLFLSCYTRSISFLTFFYTCPFHLTLYIPFLFPPHFRQLSFSPSLCTFPSHLALHISFVFLPHSECPTSFFTSLCASHFLFVTVSFFWVNFTLTFFFSPHFFFFIFIHSLLIVLFSIMAFFPPPTCTIFCLGSVYILFHSIHTQRPFKSSHPSAHLSCF